MLSSSLALTLEFLRGQNSTIFQGDVISRMSLFQIFCELFIFILRFFANQLYLDPAILSEPIRTAITPVTINIFTVTKDVTKRSMVSWWDSNTQPFNSLFISGFFFYTYVIRHIYIPSFYAFQDKNQCIILDLKYNRLLLLYCISKQS